MNRLRELRKEKKMTQQDVASVLGVERSTYGKYETGAIPLVNVDLLKTLSDLFGASPDYIRGISDFKAIEPAITLGEAKASMVRLVDRISDEQAEKLFPIMQAVLAFPGSQG